jgi:cytochrome c556
MKHMKLIGAASALVLSTLPLWAQDDPFADVVETRHGLMMQMASDLGKMGETPYDAAIAGKAAANVAAIASVVSMDNFPAGSENGKAADSYAKAEIWSNNADFLGKLADLNTAAVALTGAAGKDADTMKAAFIVVGKACSACHESYRQPQP